MTERIDYPPRTRQAIDEAMGRKDGIPYEKPRLLEPTMTQLLPCPFCHGRADVVEAGLNGRLMTYGLVEHEEGCFFLADGLPIKYQHVMQEDFAAWNRRA